MRKKQVRTSIISSWMYISSLIQNLEDKKSFIVYLSAPQPRRYDAFNATSRSKI